jgi:hypothetical protein
MNLLFLYGPPAVGKLTVAQELAALTGFRLFHNHLTVDLAQALFDFGTPPFGRYLDHLRMEAFETAAKENVSGLIFTFVYSYPFDSLFVEDVKEIVEANGGRVCFVQLVCDRAELERRVLNDTRQRTNKIKTVEKLQEVLGRFELFTPIPHVESLTIDTAKTSPQDAARRIVERFGLNLRLESNNV